MLVLCDIGALDVAEGRIRLDDADVAEVLEGAKVFVLFGPRGPVDGRRSAIISL